MNILFVDHQVAHTRLLPLTFTRPIADLRVGILTLAEKWSKRLGISELGYQTEPYLQKKFTPVTPSADTLWIYNGIIPDEALVARIMELSPGEVLYKEDRILASRGEVDGMLSKNRVEFSGEVSVIERTWDIFSLNGPEIKADFELITRRRNSAELDDPYTRTYGEDIFLEEGAVVKAAILNAQNGPIYLGKNSEVQEGAIIQGPFGMGEGSVISLGAKIRANSSMGPFCKVGGEVSNSVFWGHSNKSHDGFMGNAVIGEWCNVGAGTSNSNLKNNYDPVRMWDYSTEGFITTGLQFCGLIMADHTKCGINTMFNTGTTIGVAANIYGEGFPRTIIPSFAWGGASGFVTHQPRKAFITADIVMNRRNINLSELDKAILTHIFETTSRFRVWENK